MPRPPLSQLVQRLRCLAGAGNTDAQADGALLERFVSAGDEAAFESLLRRHGGMVLGVCHRVLLDAQDAEDAFQATFLVLVRKARTVQQSGSVASWLYGVALRVAQKAKTTAARCHQRERRAAAMRSETHATEADWSEVRPLLDEELGRLAEKYRAPLVLCYLEGKTNEEAAAQLGWTKGTVSGRLARARELLRGRLQRRGLTLASTALATLLAQNAAAEAAVSPSLLSGTCHAALGGSVRFLGEAVSTRVAALTESTLRAMRFEQWRRLAVVCCLLLGVGLGTVLALRPAAPPAVVYLADLQEAELRVLLPDHFEKGAAVAGSASPRSLALHPPTNGHSAVFYRLDRQFRRFDSAVGIRDGSKRIRTQAPLTFSVLGDGQLLWTSRPFYEAGDTQECSVDVEGVEVLELRCHCPSWRVYAWMAWVDPRVSR